MNACILRIEECIFQRTFPILCQGNTFCGENKCNLSPDYFPLEAHSAGKIDYEDYNFLGKTKSSFGGTTAADFGLELFKICSTHDWHCDTENQDGLNRIEHGICLQNENGKKSCQCSIDRTGETCAQLKSIGANQTNSSLFTLPNGQSGYLGICTSSSCQNCWIFGIFTMFLMVIVVAVLVRKQPVIQLQAGNLPNFNSVPVDRSSPIPKNSGDGWQKPRQNAISKVSSTCTGGAQRGDFLR